jgi:putative hydroxymethylpyrimidine transporter CytX
MSNHESHLAHDNVQPTPMNERTMGLFSSFSLWLGSNVVITTVFTGGLFIPDMSYLTALSVILIGSLVGAIFLTLAGNIGTRTGLPTMILTRGAFGTRGGHIPSLANTIVLIGWSWVQAYMAGLSLNQAVKYLTGWENINFWTIFTQVIVILVTIFGHKGIEKFASLAAHLMIWLCVVLVGYMLTKYHISDIFHLTLSKNPQNTFMTAFDMVVATSFSWLPCVCDFNRNAKSSKAGVIGTYAGYNIGTFIAMGLGATVSSLSIIMHVTQTYDPAILIGAKNPWLGLISALVVFLSVVSTNVMALYSSTMSFLAVFTKQKFVPAALSIGVLTVVGALLKQWLLNHFQNFLFMIGTLFIPVTALLIIDYYLVKRGFYDAHEIIDNHKKTYWYSGGFNIQSFLSFVIGASFGYYFTYVHLLPTGATVLTFLVTSFVYWGLMKLQKAFGRGQKKVLDQVTVGK